jgi:hypothetical protein
MVATRRTGKGCTPNSLEAASANFSAGTPPSHGETKPYGAEKLAKTARHWPAAVDVSGKDP